jgi:hypothetical protein
MCESPLFLFSGKDFDLVVNPDPVRFCTLDFLSVLPMIDSICLSQERAQAMLCVDERQSGRGGVRGEWWSK